jgi:hypothetical protein
MSRSYRSEKESKIASRNIRRDSDGRPILPRIIERKPRPGDFHPMSKKIVTKMLAEIPEKYVYGLSRVELRARKSTEIGEPFGLYLIDEKAIFLYSLPSEWSLPSMTLGFELELRAFYPEIIRSDNCVTVRWPNTDVMSLWFYCCVLTHELGHHFRNQYRYKRKQALHADEEMVAQLHAERLKTMLFKSLSERIRKRDVE